MYILVGFVNPGKVIAVCMLAGYVNEKSLEPASLIIINGIVELVQVRSTAPLGETCTELGSHALVSSELNLLHLYRE
jgi:hypothetical protein